MIEAPQVANLSQITKEAPVVGGMLDNGPVMLMQKSNPFGMLVKVEEWNHTARQLRDMKEVFHLLETEFKDEPNKYTMHELIGLVQARRADRESTQWLSGDQLREKVAAKRG